MSTTFRVTVIDDDPVVRQLVQVVLQLGAGWEVATAASGIEGLQLVRESVPDVVVVDRMMPNMSGDEVCRRLKEDPKTAGIPLVLLTGREQMDDAEVESMGAAGVIFKPFDPDTLAARICELCGLGTNG